MLRTQTRALERIAQYLGEQEARRIVGSIADAQRLEHWGRKVYSQTDQDGILGEILRRIGAGPNAGILIEFGVEDGLQNNTHWLLRQGYPTVWLEASDRHVAGVRRLFGHYVRDGALTVAHERVERDTVDARLAALADGRPVTVLSIDVDGNDYWLWGQIESIRPSVVVIEYNASFPPPVSVVQPYNPEPPGKVRADDWGASLSPVGPAQARTTERVQTGRLRDCGNQRLLCPPGPRRQGIPLREDARGPVPPVPAEAGRRCVRSVPRGRTTRAGQRLTRRGPSQQCLQGAPLQ